MIKIYDMILTIFTKIYRSTNSIIVLGSLHENDKLIQKKIQRLNFYTYVSILYFLIHILLNIFYKKINIAIICSLELVLIQSNYLFFRKFKSIKIYSSSFASIITVSLCIVLATGIGFHIAMLSAALAVLIVMDVTSIKIGCFSSFSILLAELIIYSYNKNYIELSDFIFYFVIQLWVFLYSIFNQIKSDEMYNDLQKEKEDKEHLFINIVHDIKTPLTMIHNNIDKCIYEENSIESKEVLKSNIIRMEKNIINILNIDRIEKGLFNIDSSVTNISSITKEVCNLYFDYASSRGLDLKQDIENDIYVKIDNTSFMEIINNLLDNAVKFTSNGDSIKVSVRKYQGKAILKVIDTGIGVADSEKEKIFTKYYQAHKRFGSYYGLGIGLAFVKKICQAFNGNIYVESSLNCGSTFFVEFPISLEKSNNTLDFKKDLFIPKLSNEPQNKAIANNSKKILIIEDNNDIRNMLINSLSSLYNIASARNGHEAIELCKNVGHFDLIITDIMMPIMDGEEFVKHLRNKIGDSITPVIFLTAKSGTTNIIDYLSLGAIDFISKPFSIEELLSKINSILNTFNHRDKFFVNNISSILEEYVDKNYNTKSVQQKMNQDPNPERLREFNITKKEEIIIKELWKGLSNKEIAENQNISLSTVKTHVYRIYKKCNINNATTLLKFFYHY